MALANQGMVMTKLRETKGNKTEMLTLAGTMVVVALAPEVVVVTDRGKDWVPEAVTATVLEVALVTGMAITNWEIEKL